MAEAVEVMLRRLREAADTRGSDWLEQQVTALLGGAEVGTSSPTPAATRPRRVRPPARLSPDLPPRVRRRVRSPTRDPPRREHSKATAASRRGRNPYVRRDPPEAVGPSPQPIAPATGESGPGSAGSPPVPRSRRPAQRGRGSGSRGSSGAARSARAARRRPLQDEPLSVAHEAAPVGARDGRRPCHDALLTEEEDEAVLDGSPPQSRPLGHEDRRADAYMEDRELRRPFPEGGQFATGPDTVEDRGRPRAIPNAPSSDPAGVLPANSASTHQRNVVDPGVVRQEAGPAAAGFTAPGQLVGAVSPAGPGGESGRIGVSRVVVGDPGGTVACLLQASLSEGTWRMYDRAWSRWQQWCNDLGVEVLDGEIPLLLFIGHVKDQGWSVAKINGCMAGLAFGFKLRNSPDITKSFLVRQILKGYRRFQRVKDSRLPVSFSLLLQLGEQVAGVCRSAWEVSLFRLAFALAFFGAFRLGELVCASVQREGGLRSEDVTLYDDRVLIYLRFSKTDQEGRGHLVSLFEVPGCLLCPVRCLRDFQGRAGVAAGPILRHEDGSFLSRFQFIAVFKKCLRNLGMDSGKFTGHSFRIGAATEAARLGVRDEVIKRIGRWESERFRLYVRLGAV
ncbi:uncharacterized protein LOC121003196 isoform X1 [Bufo bufo]|uniref:uncharacterized protein LOC121003196 isoform X1 n=1 Tax=Bufo bufo TaxID=8384 RepID=UPI001ABEC1B7|nr:uncharacterized protein LOC121003196 isoform X1 [Bufo bufo]